ncbi:MAG: hypothetical protein Q9170_002058 [Blastenia crenularia]
MGISEDEWPRNVIANTLVTTAQDVNAPKRVFIIRLRQARPLVLQVSQNLGKMTSIHITHKARVTVRDEADTFSYRLDQLTHLPWFLAKYERWWMMERVRLVAEVDIAILILRICSYASQFLPSPGYTLDKIRGLSLADVCKTCDETASSLESISAAADACGSLIRIQHLTYFGLRCQIEGHTITFWEVLSRAIRIAQSNGIPNHVTRPRQGMNESDQEMERKTICNLYIWDNLLSRQLDRTAFFSRSLQPGNRPQINLISNRSGANSQGPGSDAPDLFTERLLQAHLAEFWRSTCHSNDVEHDMVMAEERYEKFCSDYLSQLPAAFALTDPDKRWDKRLPKLPLQRHLLHVAIYDSLYWHFRPLLLLHAHRNLESSSLPTYKRVLLSSQEKALAIAALRAIEGVTQLHILLGGPQTRFAVLIVSTFEAAVVLVSVCMDPFFPGDNSNPYLPLSNVHKAGADPLKNAVPTLTRQGCLQAAQGALKRLRMLAEGNSMAETGARTLAQLLSRLPGTTTKTSPISKEKTLSQSQDIGNAISTTTTTKSTSSQLAALMPAGEMANWLPYEPPDLRSLKDFTSISETSTVGDMASWSSFDPSSTDSPSEFVSMNAMQDMQNSCATSVIDFGH